MVWQANYEMPDSGSGPQPVNLDLEHFFRQDDCQWKAEHVVAYKRRFPRGKIRNIYKQVGFKSLLYRYGPVIDKDTPNIKEIRVTVTKGADEPWAIIDVTVEHIGPGMYDPFDFLSLDLSGQFYVSFEEGQTPLQIQKLDTDTNGLDGRVYRIFVQTSDDVISNLPPQYFYYWNTIKFFRYFTDQHLDLLGYSLTYRVIGGRTHGFKKAVELGGNDA
jgi:hypothetical protein